MDASLMVSARRRLKPLENGVDVERRAHRDLKPPRRPANGREYVRSER
jgi:hypothetical protein